MEHESRIRIALFEYLITPNIVKNSHQAWNSPIYVKSLAQYVESQWLAAKPLDSGKHTSGP